MAAEIQKSPTITQDVAEKWASSLFEYENRIRSGSSAESGERSSRYWKEKLWGAFATLPGTDEWLLGGSYLLAVVVGGHDVLKREFIESQLKLLVGSTALDHMINLGKEYPGVIAVEEGLPDLSRLQRYMVGNNGKVSPPPWPKNILNSAIVDPQDVVTPQYSEDVLKGRLSLVGLAVHAYCIEHLNDPLTV